MVMDFWNLCVQLVYFSASYFYEVLFMILPLAYHENKFLVLDSSF